MYRKIKLFYCNKVSSSSSISSQNSLCVLLGSFEWNRGKNKRQKIECFFGCIYAAQVPVPIPRHLTHRTLHWSTGTRKVKITFHEINYLQSHLQVKMYQLKSHLTALNI